MKRYFKRKAESSLGVGVVYLEFDGEKAIRQIEVYDGRWFYSDNQKDYFPEIGPGIIDQPLSSLELTPGEEISAVEFEQAWQEANHHPKPPHQA